MSGIYIHIPFCKKACHYCDFHFSTSLKYAEEMVEAICKEIVLKKSRVTGEIGSIYIGGGTPSILPVSAFHKIFDTITHNFTLSAAAEITLEANPDDLNSVKIKELQELPVNRFSLGIQSFFDEDLLWMNRAHSSGEAENSVKRAQDAGYENLSLDLIYGYPLLTDAKLAFNIEKAIALDVPHISAYSLTVEERTALADSIRKGLQKGLSDAQSAEQFVIMTSRLTESGFDHYEISNFALPGCHAQHNTNYWRGIPYLGIGPSAHGFDGDKRYLNIPNNVKYMESVLSGKFPETIEHLTWEDKLNEYIMTSLRTMWGIDLQIVKETFGEGSRDLMLRQAMPFVEEGKVILKDNVLNLSADGKLFADRIASELFILSDDRHS